MGTRVLGPTISAFILVYVAVGAIAQDRVMPPDQQQAQSNPMDHQKGGTRLAAGGNPEQAFNNACRTCHTIREGENRQGPTLHKIVGRKAGSLADYNYSSAMKEAGFVWDEDKLARFIAKPDDVVPGNNMKPYGGLASTDDAAQIVAFLASISN
jgi:cytochrome c2